MAIMRITSVLERSENSFLRAVLTEKERQALATVRNIVAHGGYAKMDDDSFWITATEELPDLVRRLKRALEAPPPPV